MRIKISLSGYWLCVLHWFALFSQNYRILIIMIRGNNAVELFERNRLTQLVGFFIAFSVH